MGQCQFGWHRSPLSPHRHPQHSLFRRAPGLLGLVLAVQDHLCRDRRSIPAVTAGQSPAGLSLAAQTGCGPLHFAGARFGWAGWAGHGVNAKLGLSWFRLSLVMKRSMYGSLSCLDGSRNQPVPSMDSQPRCSQASIISGAFTLAQCTRGKLLVQR